MASVVKTSIALADRKEGEEPARLEFQWPRGGRLGARPKNASHLRSGRAANNRPGPLLTVLLTRLSTRFSAHVCPL